MEAITKLLQAQLHAHIDTSMTSGEKAAAFVLITSTVAGFFFLASKFYSFVRLIFSLFILPGIPVSNSFLSLPTPIFHLCSDR